ncbi:unnamed protein product [Gadus morhua 'NCC']
MLFSSCQCECDAVLLLSVVSVMLFSSCQCECDAVLLLSVSQRALTVFPRAQQRSADPSLCSRGPSSALLTPHCVPEGPAALC